MLRPSQSRNEENLATDYSRQALAGLQSQHRNFVHSQRTRVPDAVGENSGDVSIRLALIPQRQALLTSCSVKVALQEPAIPVHQPTLQTLNPKPPGCCDPHPTKVQPFAQLTPQVSCQLRRYKVSGRGLGFSRVWGGTTRRMMSSMVMEVRFASN